jgi:hypothetical protein
MGLAGPKNKQRIGADPNNLHWSNGSLLSTCEFAEK